MSSIHKGQVQPQTLNAPESMEHHLIRTNNPKTAQELTVCYMEFASRCAMPAWIGEARRLKSRHVQHSACTLSYTSPRLRYHNVAGCDVCEQCDGDHTQQHGHIDPGFRCWG